MRFGRRPVAVVLGAGPAGLLAAHAAEERGWEVNIFSAPGPDGAAQKSELHGCQYLHARIPGLGHTLDGLPVRYQLDGTVDGYRRKVYGDRWAGEVSPDEYGPEKDHMAWDLRKAYDALWHRFGPKVAPLTLGPELAERLAKVKGQHVLCTVPAEQLCQAQGIHKFVTQGVWAMGTRTESMDVLANAANVHFPYRAPDMTVLCNGHDAPRWYRAATVFGQSTLEWPAGPKPPIEGVVAVTKPLSTDCDCHVSSRWHRLGRYGKWQKGVLVHTAYEETRELLR